jgi:hypothetical protein
VGFRRGAPGLGKPPPLCLACLADRPGAPFAVRLRAYRVAAGLTVVRLAARSGVGASTLWTYEAGGCPPLARNLAKLVRVLGPGVAAR